MRVEAKKQALASEFLPYRMVVLGPYSPSCVCISSYLGNTRENPPNLIVQPLGLGMDEEGKKRAAAVCGPTSAGFGRGQAAGRRITPNPKK